MNFDPKISICWRLYFAFVCLEVNECKFKDLLGFVAFSHSFMVQKAGLYFNYFSGGKDCWLRIEG